MVIIVAPSLDEKYNVSGVSSVVKFIVDNNNLQSYVHFQQGKMDDEKGGFCRLVRVWKSYLEWKRLLATYSDACIHYNYPLDTPSIVRDYFFIHYAYKHERKIVIHLHGGLYLFKNNKPWFIDYILKKVFGFDIPLIVLSNKEQEHICLEYHRKDVYSLPNCIDLSLANSFKRQLHKDKLRLLYLGRIEKNKGVDYILDALKILKSNGIDFVFRMAGKESIDGEYIKRFTDALNDSFKYEGVVYGKSKDELLMNSDVFVLPSFYEGMPMSLLESMSFGLVPVVTDVGSIGEYVRDNENGIIVKVKDSGSIVRAIESLNHDRLLFARLSESAQQTIFSRLNSKDYINKLNQIYQLANVK